MATSRPSFHRTAPSLKCRRCGKGFTDETAKELPCGHCICVRCASELETATQALQKCPVLDCPSQRATFKDRIRVGDLPVRPVAALDRFSVVTPPLYVQAFQQERPSSVASTNSGASGVSSSTTTSSTSSIFSHSEFHSVNYCFNHPNFTRRYYCETCRQFLCEDCWAEEHRDKTKHSVSLMKVILEPQKEVQTRLAEYKTECQSMTRLCEGGWTSVLRQVFVAEKKQSNVMKSKSANELETKSEELREFLRAHLNDMKDFKSKILAKFDVLEAKWGVIFGDSVGGGGGSISEGSSSSTIGDDAHSSNESEQDALIGGREGIGVSSGAVGGESVSPVSGKKEVVARKRRTLVGVQKKAVGDDVVPCLQAVYNTETKEVVCLRWTDYEILIRVCGSAESSGLVKQKRTMDWTALRGNGEELCMIAMDSNNVLYGRIVRNSDGVERVEILDQNTLEKKGLLDTDGIENGRSTSWMVSASGHTVIVAVIDRSTPDWKWTSATVFINKQRQCTVSLDIAADGALPTSSCILANETTLLLYCGHNTNRVAVVSLPPTPTPSDTASGSKSKTTTKAALIKTNITDKSTPTTSTLKPISVIYIILSEVEDVFSLVWMPSDGVHSQAQLLTGHLWVADIDNGTSRVYELDIKKDVSQSEPQEEITLYSKTNIAPLEYTILLCNLDQTTIFGENCETGELKPCLFHLDYQLAQ